MEKKITSREDLKALRDRAQGEIDIRTGPKDIQITVHMGTCGIAAGARTVLVQLAAELSGASINNVTLRQSGCYGLCDQEPMLTLTDKSGGVFQYGKLDAAKVQEIVGKHLLNGVPVVDYLIKT